MPRVHLVHLRQPSKRTDRRDDPFWEFGSFGLTGCHNHNLLHVRHATKLDGAHLAFVQGGHAGPRLLFVTPPIRVIRHRNVLEVLWSPAAMPFRYAAAPLIADEDYNSDFPFLLPLFNEVHRNSPLAQFASKFRSNVSPLRPDVSERLLRGFARMLKVGKSALAESYEQALPCMIVNADTEDNGREKRYEKLLEKANADRASKCTKKASSGRAC